MRRIWVTSDLHIGHNKEFVYKERGFQSIEEHDSALLSNWNELVSPDDVVYVPVSYTHLTLPTNSRG